MKKLRRVLFVLACLVTVVLLFFTEENVRGRLAWQKHRRILEQQGEQFSLQALIPPPVPDEKNFALTPLLRPLLEVNYGPSGAVWRDTNGFQRIASKISAELPSGNPKAGPIVRGTVYKGTFTDLSNCATFYRGNTNYPQASTSAPPARQVLTALGKFDPEINELRTAAATRPYSRFPIQYDYEPPELILLPHLGPIKSLTSIISLRAIALLEERRASDAFEDLKLGLRLSESIHDEPLLIDHLVRIATLGVGLQVLREGLVRHLWTDAQLLELQKYLKSINLLAEYKLAMRGERAFGTAGLDYYRRHRFGARSLTYQNENGGAIDSPRLNFVPGGFYYQNMITISRMHQQITLRAVDEQAHRVFPDVSQNGMRALQRMKVGPYTIFVKMLMPAFERAALKSSQMQTYLDEARVSCALERYHLGNGAYPDSFDALLPGFIERIPNDVIDGKPLRYRRLGPDEYVFYSIGWNGTDEGGVLGRKKQSKHDEVDPNLGDWVWQIPSSL